MIKYSSTNLLTSITTYFGWNVRFTRSSLNLKSCHLLIKTKFKALLTIWQGSDLRIKVRNNMQENFWLIRLELLIGQVLKIQEMRTLLKSFRRLVYNLRAKFMNLCLENWLMKKMLDVLHHLTNLCSHYI